MPKMNVTTVTAMTNNKKERSVNIQKQSQTNPIQSQFLSDIRGCKAKQTQSCPPQL
jgi:hypothetical protein